MIQEIIDRSKKALEGYSKLSLNQRKGIINSIKAELIPHVTKLANM